LLGYFFHLVTDNLWSLWIGKPTMERFKDQFEADPGFIWEVKKDWYGLDFAYVRANPDSLFWTIFLQSEYRENYLEFLPEAGVRHQIRYIQDYYQRNDEKVEQIVVRPRQYLTEAEMDIFIERACATVEAGYQWVLQGDDLAGGSVLEKVLA
jgi:hypothetical protein